MILFLSSLSFFFPVLFSLHFLNPLPLALCIICISILQFSIFLPSLSMVFFPLLPGTEFLVIFFCIFAHLLLNFFFSSSWPSSSLSIQSLSNMKMERQKSYPVQDQAASPFLWHQIAIVIKRVLYSRRRSLHHHYPTCGEKRRKLLLPSLHFLGETNLLLFSQEARQKIKQISPSQMFLKFLLLVIMSEVPEISSGVGVASLNCNAAESFFLLLLKKGKCSMYKQGIF